ncbi:MAG TPA: hypothetical protein VLN59_12770, partial [Burkholderiales bacterium]|nr:hypothetical protein [Burkholderiales bacterium]
MAQRQQLVRQQTAQLRANPDLVHFLIGALEHLAPQGEGVLAHATHQLSELLQLGVVGQLLTQLDLRPRQRTFTAAEMPPPAFGIAARIIELLQDAIGLRFDTRAVAFRLLVQVGTHLPRFLPYAPLAVLGFAPHAYCQLVELPLGGGGGMLSQFVGGVRLCLELGSLALLLLQVPEVEHLRTREHPFGFEQREQPF